MSLVQASTPSTHVIYSACLPDQARYIMWKERNHHCFVYMLVLILFSVLPFLKEKKKHVHVISIYILNINIFTLLVYAASNDCVLCNVYCLRSCWVCVSDLSSMTVWDYLKYHSKFIVSSWCHTYCSATSKADVVGTIKCDTLQWNLKTIDYGGNLYEPFV